MGLIPSRWSAFSILPLQASVILPLLAALMFWLRRAWAWSRCWLAIGLLTLAVFFLGRGFVTNYFDLVVDYLLLGTLLGTLKLRRGDSPPAARLSDPDRGASALGGIQDPA